MSRPAEGAAAVRRLQLRMLMDAPATEFSKAFRKGVTRNLSDAQRQWLDAMGAKGWTVPESNLEISSSAVRISDRLCADRER